MSEFLFNFIGFTLLGAVAIVLIMGKKQKRGNPNVCIDTFFHYGSTIFNILMILSILTSLALGGCFMFII